MLQNNSGETLEIARGVFFCTAPSQKTPRTRTHTRTCIASFLFLFSLFFSLSLVQTHALRTISVAPTVSSINNGLVGYWTFDGKSLTNATATNSAGTSYDGALTNMTATSSKVIGKIGQALTFNGSNQYVNVGNNPLVGATKFTYSSWIKVSTSDFTGNFKTLVDDATGDANVNNGIVVGVDDRGGSNPTAGITAEFHTATGCTLVYSSNIFSSTSQWYHIVLTYNGVSNPTLYINGVTKSYTTGVCPSGSGVYVPRSANMWLGAINNGTFYFKGTMDDVRIYNRAISAKEVQTLYQMGGNKIVTPPSGPVGYWKFNSNTISGTNAIDSSFNNTTGAIQGSPSIVSGKIGQALSFNGSTDYVAMGTPSSLQLSNGTISAWVNTSTCSGTCGIIWKRYAYGLYLSNGLVAAYDGGGGSVSAVNIADGRWHHVLCVFQSGVASGSGIYVDGVRVLTFTHSIFANNVGLSVGSDSGRFFFTGLIDDPRVYDRVLSAVEVKTLYKNSINTISYGTTISSTVPVSSGLVGYWTFDGKNLTNATVTDSGGSGNDGSFVNMTANSSIAIGKIGQALNFSKATNNGVSVGTNPSIRPTSAVTAGLWFKVTDNITLQQLYRASDFAGAPGFSLFIGNTSGKAGFFISPSGSTVETNVNINQWNHLVGTYDGSIQKLYLNGNLVATTSVSGSLAYNGDASTIGFRNLSGGQIATKGLIDDVRVYNRALSAKEVQTLYKMGAR